LRQADVLVETTASTFYGPSISLLLPTSALGTLIDAKLFLHRQISTLYHVGVCLALMLLIHGQILVVLTN
jgi:glycine/serine hydroxymethyltransferase